MKVIDVGSGVPLVLVPGVQGRWEWMRPAVDALARRCRVITFSLADEPASGGRFDAGHGFSCYVDQVAEAMDRAGVERAAVCGASYGGLIAAAFAARHPERVSALVLVSAVPPSWRPDPRVRLFLRAPWLLSPLFALSSLRFIPEIAAAAPSVAASAAAAGRIAWHVMRHLPSPGRVARRVRLLDALDLRGALATVEVPALVVTGDAALDRVVPVAGTREYLRLLRQAHAATLDRTGHLGLVTRPEALAALVGAFIERRTDGRSPDASAGTGDRTAVPEASRPAPPWPIEGTQLG